jgi:COMPASS component SPP1
MYNKNGKSASNSKKIRATGDTYKLALKMLEEKKDDLLQQVAAVRAAVASGKPIPVSKPKPPPIKMKVEKKESFTDLRDDTFTSDNIPMSISEKIKSEGRARKFNSDAPSVSASSNHGSPAPSTAPKMSSPAPAKADKPPSKKRGTAAPVKKSAAKKPRPEGTLSLLNTSLPYPKL